jgi:MFS family permease
MPLAFNASTLDPFIYNEKVRTLAPAEFKNTILGGITILALLMALVVQPLVGQWSDRTHSRWGKRAQYLVAGSLGMGFALAVVVGATSLWLLLIGAMLASVFSNTAQSAWQALIPDYIPPAQHGTSAGAKTVLELIGIVAGVAVVGYFLSRGNLWITPTLTTLLFFLALVVTLPLVLRTAPYAGDDVPQQHANPFTTLLVSLKKAPPAFLWWMLNRFLFWAAAISIRTFLLNYVEDVLGYSPAEAQALSSQILIILGLGVFLLALPAGAIADRVGRRPILILAGFMASVGAILMVFFRDLTVLYVAGSLIAAGTGIFASASWALATNLAPQEEGALYLALANAATVVGSIGGRTGGAIIDGLNQLLGTVAFGYMVDFALAALFFVGSSLVALKIPETVPRETGQQ